MTGILVGCLLFAPQGRDVAPGGLASTIREAVDTVDPVARRRAADRLAARPESLAEMCTAMRKFGDFAAAVPGRSRENVELWVGGRVEATELHLYTPKNYRPGVPAPLLVLGHGTGGNGRQMLPMWIEFAERTGTVLLAPSEAGANGGWAFSERERESARSAIRHVRRRFDIDENRIYCSGISRGGHLAWDVALRYPDLFAAIAPMIGGPRIKLVQGQNNTRYLENVAQLPIRDLQGAKDDRYLVANVRWAFTRLKELKAADAKLVEFPDLGHSFRLAAVDWVEFLGRSKRDPRPRRVVRMVAEPREVRAFWVEVQALDTAKVKVVPRLVATRAFTALDELGQRAYVAREVERHTARLEVVMSGPGDFTAKSRLLRSFRLLLDERMLVAGKGVVVKHNGVRRVHPLERSKRVLCREFVERFDRTFLPIAEVVVR
ncbi:MAG: hypothetical protein KDC87_03345 [Planctomycetes bacterium]|nr:hypothetical protein [Planctomycetota bacterium]MCB9868852.1 hypothetical protein [Planctomycetota bacterium]